LPLAQAETLNSKGFRDFLHTHTGYYFDYRFALKSIQLRFAAVSTKNKICQKKFVAFKNLLYLLELTFSKTQL